MTQLSEERLYLLGHPISHSKSPVMHEAVYRKLGLPWRYELADRAAPEEAEAFLAAKDFLALNVTTPYKPLAFASADVAAASAQLAKGANVIVAHKERLLAYNTDGEGCIAYLRHAGVELAGRNVAICGTGPTSLAILHAATLCGPESVVLLSREVVRAKAALEEYVESCERMLAFDFELPAAQKGRLTLREAYDKVALRYGSYRTSTKAIRRADVVINTTPLGMKKGDGAPFDVALLSADQTAFDVVYGHGETAFAAGAQAAGSRFLNGEGMLVGQAIATVQIVCDIKGIALELSWDEMFALMAEAAGFQSLIV